MIRQQELFIVFPAVIGAVGLLGRCSAGAALNGEKPRVSIAKSRGNVATIMTLLESARTGEPVRP